MRAILLLMLAACVIASHPASAQEKVSPERTMTDEAWVPSVNKVVEFAKASPFKTLIYAEVGEIGSDPREVIGLGIIGQLPNTNTLVQYGDDKRANFMLAIILEAQLSKDGWRKILIIADKGAVTVTRGPSPGPIDGFNERLKNEIGRAFPGQILKATP